MIMYSYPPYVVANNRSLEKNRLKAKRQDFFNMSYLRMRGGLSAHHVYARSSFPSIHFFQREVIFFSFPFLQKL